MRPLWKGGVLRSCGLWLMLFSARAEAEEPMKPPGDCTKEEHRELKKAVGQACKSTSMQCYEKDDCATLWMSLIQRSECIAARQRIAGRCFHGGDALHRQEMDNYRAGADKCRRIIAAKRCPPEPCECVEPVRGRRAPSRRTHDRSLPNARQALKGNSRATCPKPSALQRTPSNPFTPRLPQ
jgi:hypothetical protein